MDQIIELMDTTRISSNFPTEPKNEIFRENILETIKELFKDNSTITIEGLEGIGKTTLIAQYARSFPNNTISIFITPATRSSYSLDGICLDLISQINWILNRKELSSDEIESMDFSSKLLRELALLQKFAKSHHEHYYFVLDGVCEIPDTDSSYRDQIFDLIPFGYHNEFKILISGNYEKIPLWTRNYLQHKSFPMPFFSFDEAEKNLEGLGFGKDEIKDIYKIYKKPGELASIRRSIEAGESTENFILNLPEKLDLLLELEWKNIDGSNETLIQSLAIICYSNIAITLETLSKIINTKKEELSDLLSNVQILNISDSGIISFVSDAQFQKAKAKLYESKNKAETKIIDYLRTSDDPLAPYNLTTVYEKTNKHSELIQFTTTEILSKIMDSSQSLVPLVETTMRCVNSANVIDKNIELVDFSLQTAIIKELYSATAWESEITALISLNNINSSLALVDRANTKEDQLVLLSILANAKEKYKLDIHGLDERIERLFNQVNRQMLGDKAIDIAANLINIYPELAINIVESSVNTETHEQDLDLAYTKLSIRSLEDNSFFTKSSDILEKIVDRVKDPVAKSIIKSQSLSFHNYSAERVIAETKKIEKVIDKIYLLRSWVTRNRENDDAGKVIEYALQMLIKTSEYSPTARDFRIFSSPLPYVNDLEMRKKLIGIIDAQKNTCESLGPIDDYVRILIILGMAEKDINLDSCLNRFIDAFIYIDDLDDISTKCTCFARLCTGLTITDPEKTFESRDKLHSVTKSNLEKLIQEILDNTADQYIITKNIIRALSKFHTEYSYEVAGKLNTEDSRNKAYFDIVNSILNLPDKKLNFDQIMTGYHKISEKETRDDLLLRMLQRINSINDPNIIDNEDFSFVFNEIEKIDNSSSRCNAICIYLNYLQENNNQSNNEVINTLFTLLKNSWESIDFEWDKVDKGFKIVEALCEYEDLARDMFKIVEQFRKCIKLETSEIASTYIVNVKLALRAFKGLISDQHDTEEDLHQLHSLISSIQSNYVRIELYNYLALIFWLERRNNEFNNIVENNIKSLIRSFPKYDKAAWQKAIIEASPALYLNHHNFTFNLIASVDDINIKDQAYLEICSFILSKRIHDPYFDPGRTKGEKLSYEEIIDIIEILEKIDVDSSIYHLISEVCDNVLENKTYLNKNEKADIARKLEEVANHKLPNDRYIKHEGFKIISLAHIGKLKNVKDQDWNNLIKRTSNINISDQVFIKAVIADCLPNNQIALKEKLLNDIEKLILKIPSIYDQINRYELLANIFIDEKQTSEKMIKAGMELLIRLDEPNLIITQRQLIDLAYKLDPDFAASLASMADNDPARANSKYILQKRMEIHNFKKQVLANDNSRQQLPELEFGDYPEVAWMMLGSLNAGRISVRKPNEMKNFAYAGANLTMLDAYPIFAWIIQNCVNKYKKTPQVSEIIRPLFKAPVKGCDLILNIANKSVVQVKKAKAALSEDTLPSTVIADMDSDEAKDLIKYWLRANLKDELIIADAYFEITDLWILKEIIDINPKSHTYILTSKKQINKYKNPQNEFNDFWRREISDHEPPNTEFIITDIDNTQLSPIHDRWWISGSSGIRIGTSTNSIGEKRISEFGDLTVNEVDERKEIIGRFIFQKIRDYKGNKISYTSFTL